MMNFYSVLLFFFIFGLFNVNSCDCCKGNKSSGSASSDAKSGSPLIDISGKKVEELESLPIIGAKNGSQLHGSDISVFNCFTGNKYEHSVLGDFLAKCFNQEKIRVFYKDGVHGGSDVINFVSSDVVSSLCLDINNANLHKLNNQIYYFYYFLLGSKVKIGNNDNVFANLDISNLKWYD